MSCLQAQNNIRDAGACGLGGGLKANVSLQMLSLVRALFFVLFLFVFCFVFGLVELCCDRFLESMFDLTRGMQGNNKVGDVGAVGLGEGLKMNSSLLMLNLVGDLCLRLFPLFFVEL